MIIKSVLKEDGKIYLRIKEIQELLKNFKVKYYE